MDILSEIRQLLNQHRHNGNDEPEVILLPTKEYNRLEQAIKSMTGVLAIEKEKPRTAEIFGIPVLPMGDYVITGIEKGNLAVSYVYVVTDVKKHLAVLLMVKELMESFLSKEVVFIINDQIKTITDWVANSDK